MRRAGKRADREDFGGGRTVRIKCVAAKVEEGPSRGDWALLSPLLRSGTGARARRWGEDDQEMGEGPPASDGKAARAGRARVG